MSKHVRMQNILLISRLLMVTARIHHMLIMTELLDCAKGADTVVYCVMWTTVLQEGAMWGEICEQCV